MPFWPLLPPTESCPRTRGDSSVRLRSALTHRKKTGPEATAKVLAGWAMWLVAAAAAVSGSTEGVSLL